MIFRSNADRGSAAPDANAEAVDGRLEAVQQALSGVQNNTAIGAQTLQRLSDLVLYAQSLEQQRHHPNPLAACGKKCFSQTDEDGITLEILRRLELGTSGAFAEFGVGDGMENNTLILAALGWRGFWCGGEELAFRYRANDKLLYQKDWITLDNIGDLAARGREFLRGRELDVVSLDLDGNDVYFVGRLLDCGVTPKLFIVEYNAKFPPPVRFQIAYDAKFQWQGDDYFGASLATFVDLFARHGYRLVCCNAHTGANAFFVRGDCTAPFGDVPIDIGRIHVAPRYQLYHFVAGHRPSARTVETILGLNAS